jgi:hypothetical protein
MLRALGWLLAMIVLVGGGWWLYTHIGSRAVSTSGDVFPRDASSDPPDAKDDVGSPAPANPAPASVAPALTTVTNTPAPAPQPAVPSPAAAKPTASLPVSDSIPRDPPIGMAFGGSGKYQWYRQGDITWRIDTISGAACIDFATMDQWARPIVYSHGCRRS